MTEAAMHLAGLTLGRRLAPTDDPRMAEALARLEHPGEHGESDHAYGWKHLKEAQAWKIHGCAQVAAE
jgi:hypothetical protein